MASVPITERMEVTQDLAVVLQSRQEQFAVLVASGLSYREAARRAGYNPDNSWRLMQTPGIRDRVAELVREPSERVRAGIEFELVMLRNRAADGDLTDADRADIELRLKLLLAHAKLAGMIVDKRQVAKVGISLRSLPRDIASMSPAAVDEVLDALAPGQRAELRRLAAGTLAAGELVAAEGQSAE